MTSCSEVFFTTDWATGAWIILQELTFQNRFSKLNDKIYSHLNSKHLKTQNEIELKNQSVEHAGVAFVKGADERNNSFEKINLSVMYDEQVQANKAKH